MRAPPPPKCTLTAQGGRCACCLRNGAREHAFSGLHRAWHAFHLPCNAAGLQASNSDTERPRPSRTRCRRRGGYFELVNFPSDVRDQLYKLSSISLCPNLSGQICMALIMNPPAAGDPSYEQYTRERDDILAVRCSAPPVLLGGRRCLDSRAACKQLQR